MYRHLQQRLATHVREFLRRTYDLDLPAVVIEQPPKVELGEYALPLAFELAKKLRKAPRKIAEEIVAGLGAVPGFDKLEIAGAGYINARVNRGEFAAALARDESPAVEVPAGKILVEHSSINPNKAAHIGHLRNAILGDTFVRLLRSAGRSVDVQNYIDNTGVQVADVVAGFLHLEKKTTAEVEALARTGYQDLGPTKVPKRFDYVCWDLYARVSQWYEADKTNLQVRAEVLHAIEAGNNPTAALAELISTTVLRQHLETMQRLDIEYDFLPRESEILHLHFWDAAFAKLKQSGVLTLETEGKNQGCWVMRRAGTSTVTSTEDTEKTEKTEIKPADLRVDTYARETDAVRITHIPTGIVVSCDSEKSQLANRHAAMALLQAKLRELQAAKISEDDQKVIVRSNGTVGYVGKDIAYHMWKFGLLGLDFGYQRFYQYPDGRDCWVSSAHGESDHPHFGDVAEIYNVIDARQSEAQNAVIEALRGLGHSAAADHYTHFSYEMVALTPNAAQQLGYNIPQEDWKRPYIEVSGRKGFGVKADDLITTLTQNAYNEVWQRHPELGADKCLDIATQIAIGALRYFMLRFTKQSVIAFDFKDALSFEGETGPYAQYAAVRATNIFRKGGLDADRFNPGPLDFQKHLSGEGADEIWELWLAAAKTSLLVDQCVATTEPAYAAKHAFQLAQLFNYFYHRHPILAEADEQRKQFLLATTAVVRRELIRVLALLGITVPPVM